MGPKPVAGEDQSGFSPDNWNIVNFNCIANYIERTVFFISINILNINIRDLVVYCTQHLK